MRHAWGRGEVFIGFWLGGPKVSDHWEDLGVGGKITFKWTLGFNMTNWIRLAQDRVQWWAFVSTVMNLRVPYKESRLLFDNLSDYQVFKEYPAPCSK
jgi:hypothetical protein